MAKKSNLPIEVHDHLGKAKLLHQYTMEGLKTASKHAYECGLELLAAKAATPHGRWEDAVERVFGESPRTAQRYMLLAKRMEALPKTTRMSLLLLEHTLDGASKAAKEALEPDTVDEPPPPPEDPPEEDDDEWVEEWMEEPDPFEAPETPETPPEEPATTEPQPEDLARKNKALAHQYRDKLARAICDYHEVQPNRAQRDKLVKIVQGVKLW